MTTLGNAKMKSLKEKIEEIEEIKKEKINDTMAIEEDKKENEDEENNDVSENILKGRTGANKNQIRTAKAKNK